VGFSLCYSHCSVLTPYYTEEVLFSLRDLETPNEDGVSILFYLQKIFPGDFCSYAVNVAYILESRLEPDLLSPDEWNNFLERVKCLSEEELKESDELEEELRLWASYRGQTLTRTGMLFWLIFFQ